MRGRPHGVSAQDLPERTRFELIGVVTDVGSDEPVAGTTVSVVELNRQATTDTSGQFRIDDVMKGRWTFRTGAFGYFDNVERSVVAEGYALVVGLAPAPFELEGLDVATETTGVATETSLAALDRSFATRTNRVGVAASVTQTHDRGQLRVPPLPVVRPARAAAISSASYRIPAGSTTGKRRSPLTGAARRAAAAVRDEGLTHPVVDRAEAEIRDHAERYFGALEAVG